MSIDNFPSQKEIQNYRKTVRNNQENQISKISDMEYKDFSLNTLLVSFAGGVDMAVD